MRLAEAPSMWLIELPFRAGYAVLPEERAIFRREMAISLELAACCRGKPRALPRNMYDVDAIEAINFEQLVTVTDRLLLRGGRPPKRRPSTKQITYPRRSEPTLVIRKPRIVDTTTLALSAAILAVIACIATLA
jgi:hypothetical protein